MKILIIHVCCHATSVAFFEPLQRNAPGKIQRAFLG